MADSFKPDRVDSFTPDAATPAPSPKVAGYQQDARPVADPGRLLLPNLPKPQPPKTFADRIGEGISNAAESEKAGASQAGELILDYSPVRGVPEAVAGVRETADAIKKHGVVSRQTAAGARRVLGGVGRSLAPLAIPAAIAAPVPTALAIGEGIALQQGTERGLKAAGVPEEYAGLAGDVAGAVPIARGASSIINRFRRSGLSEVPPIEAPAVEAKPTPPPALNPRPPEAGSLPLPIKSAAESELVPTPANDLAKNASGLASDMQRIVRDAKAKQDAFLRERGMSWDAARNLDEAGRAQLQHEYKTWLNTKGEPSGSQNIEGIPGKKHVGQEPVQAEPVQASGGEAAQTNRIFQIQGEVARRREGQRGSISTAPVKPSLEPKEYQRLEKFQSLSPESQQQFKAMVDEEVTKMRQEPRQFPLRPEKVGFAQVSEWADALSDPQIKAQVKLADGGTLPPEVRLASERAVKRWLTEQNELTQRLNTEGEKLPPTERDALQARVAQLDIDTRRVLDNLITARTQDGRNLAYHKIDLYQNGIDVVRLMGRLKRAHGGDVPAHVDAKLRELIATGDTAKIAEFMAKQEQDGWTDTIAALRKAGLLTGLKTHARNLGGNTMFQAMEEVSRIPASATDMALSLFSGRRTVAGASVRGVTNASAEAATNGVREAMTVMRRGATPKQLAQLDIPKELNSKSKIINTYVNTVFRLMSAEDRIFKSYALRRSLEAQAKVQAMNEARTKAIPAVQVNRRAIELANNPTEAMAAQAVWDADFATFNNSNVVATAISTARGVAKKHPGGHAMDFAADMVMPFVKTPTNIIARLFDYTPVGMVGKGGYHIAQAVIKKSLDAEQQRAISLAVGRGLTGTAILYLGWKAAEAGIATGTSPSDPSQRSVDEAAGRQPGSVKIGNEWHRVSPVAPGGNLFTIGATLYREATRGLKEEAKRPGNMLAVGSKTVLEQPMMQGMKEMVEAAENPEAKGERALGSMAGSFVPTLVSDVAAGLDTVKRDTRPESLLGAVGKGVAARLPVARETLPERTDVLGRQMPERGKNAVVPTIPTEAKENSDPLVRELVNEGAKIGWPSKRQGETADEYRTRAQLTGRLIESSIREVLADPRYAGLPQKANGDEIRKLVIDEAVGKARREMNDVLQDERYKSKTPNERIQLMRQLIGMVNEELAAQPAQ